LWRVLNGQRSGRTTAAQVTVFDSVGFALEDFSALRFMRDNARCLGIGQPLALIPALADPKDLFGFLRSLPTAPLHPPAVTGSEATQMAYSTNRREPALA
jgi:ornithine cyclodeaminase